MNNYLNEYRNTFEHRVVGTKAERLFKHYVEVFEAAIEVNSEFVNKVIKQELANIYTNTEKEIA